MPLLRRQSVIALFFWLLLAELAPLPTAGAVTGTGSSVKVIESVTYPGAVSGNRRRSLDLYLPATGDKKPPLVIFIHGGFWLVSDDDYRIGAYVADALAREGVAVALLRYRLAPAVRHPAQAEDVAAGIALLLRDAERYGYDRKRVYLAGHSAGGHLASRMVTTTSPLAADVAGRVRNVVSISGVHDLRPIMLTAMNQTLAIDEAEALAQSPALLRPVANARLTCWVGGGERAEFLRQNALLANIWSGLGAVAEAVVEPDRHHFNVIDGLADPDHPLTRTLIDG